MKLTRSPATDLRGGQSDSTQRMFWLTDDELWAIHDRVRQHDQQGQEWDKEAATQVMAALLKLAGHGRAEEPVMLDESDLWQIDRQIPSMLPVRRGLAKDDLLPKVIHALVDMRRDTDAT